ncbi:MAG: type II toxin-antitoxin system Phd/YefM family antitoxin [Planctomycetaceae bacterium]|nr:type II toxin-antitoxin system Phd/YefM family antitoxin [Planctomycetaceae bacterium]
MKPPIINEPGHIDEPEQAGEYAAVLSRVAAKGEPVIVRRNGTDLAAVVSLEHLELMREVLAGQEAEKLAAELDLERLARVSAPRAAWFAATEPPSKPES